MKLKLITYCKALFIFYLLRNTKIKMLYRWPIDVKDQIWANFLRVHQEFHLKFFISYIVTNWTYIICLTVHWNARVMMYEQSLCTRIRFLNIVTCTCSFRRDFFGEVPIRQTVCTIFLATIAVSIESFTYVGLGQQNPYIKNCSKYKSQDFFY